MIADTNDEHIVIVEIIIIIINSSIIVLKIVIISENLTKVFLYSFLYYFTNKIIIGI